MAIDQVGDAWARPGGELSVPLSPALVKDTGNW
jgi:hypothetical protein